MRRRGDTDGRSNTYTNATWAELSGLPLPEINVSDPTLRVTCADLA